jgi:RNA polymerase sigma factor (sigma-70 family)
MQDEQIIPQLFKTEYRKIVSVLCKLFGIEHIEVAEDIVNDTFLLAVETWRTQPVPENPTAWLYTVAKNKTKDYLKRGKVFSEKISIDLKRGQNLSEEMVLDLSPQNISDSQLQMIFAVCNPSISQEAQIGLSLRILCGFGIDEIADAFLSNKETINKRLFRAKEKLRAAQIKIEMPAEQEIETRLEMVLATIYLLFNEGYYSTSQRKTLRKELCLEAMRLNYLLLENKSTNKPNVNALMALMCFHASRFDARTNALGESILYDDQDRTKWVDELIEQGNYFLIKSAEGQLVSKYHLEASIAYWHCTKIPSHSKWENVLQLYNKLLLIDYSPMTALNRTYALAQANGFKEAIAEAEKLNLSEHHLYHALLGNLYAKIDVVKAMQHYEHALQLAKTEHDQVVLKKHIESLKK